MRLNLRCKRLFATTIVATLMFASSARAALIDVDVNAMVGWKGTKTFERGVSGLTSFDASVDYAVYAPGQFNLSFPGVDPSLGAHYVYAYQVHNTGNSGQRIPTELSVGFNVLTYGDVGSVNVGYFSPFVDNWMSPTVSEFIVNGSSEKTNAKWRTDTGWLPTTTPDGEIVLYTSPHPPAMFNATMRATGSLVSNIPLQQTLPSPAPVPEPGVVGALGAIALSLLRRRH